MLYANSLARAGDRADEKRELTVWGKAIVEARPNVAEIKVCNISRAELSSDAILKCRAARKNTIEAIEALSVPNLTIQPQGIAFSSLDFNQQNGYGDAASAVKPQTVVCRQLSLRLSQIDQLDEEKLIETLGTILDTVKDSGAQVLPDDQAGVVNALQSSPATVVFLLDNSEQLFRQALESAIADARRQADELANLASSKVDSLITVDDTNRYERREQLDSALRSPQHDKIRTPVTVQVRFSLSRKN